MYYWKMFLWECGRKSTEYSRYMDAPLFLEDKLDETLDSGEVILTGMPIASKSAFPPKTKFRLERYLTANFSDEPRHWDMIVEHDDVEEYAGCPELCTHRVYLIEASAVAQGMHVDNIALTYKLQDVTLNYKTLVSKTDTLEDMGKIDIRDNGYGNLPTHENPRIEIPSGEQSHTYYFINTYYYRWSTASDLKALLYEQDGRETHTISFNIPALWFQGCRYSGRWENLTQMATQTKIVRRLCNKDGSVESEETVDERICGPKSFSEQIDELWGTAKENVMVNPGSPTPDTPYIARGTQIMGYDNNDDSLIVGIKKQFSDLYTAGQGLDITKENPDAQDEAVVITTPVMSEAQLSAGMYYEYEITCTPYPNSDSRKLPIYYSRACYVLYNSYGLHQNMTTQQTDTINSNTLYVSAKFRIRDLSQSVDGDRFLASGKQYTCLELLRKALLTCDTRVFDNNSVGLDTLEYPIIIDPFWEKRLGNVKMHETTFEQKNLWEVLIQIGYYHHAIPYLEFADDGTDRFVLRFHQLGDTEIKKKDTSAKITVFNSRNLSEYFAQYDSYVTNLFSPQSEVEEWGVVKTSDSSYLVSNNTADIHTKYPIQEIVEFDISYGNGTQSALDMIFEESIYSILTPEENVRPSKACALFYKLGDTKISGLNYTPPSTNNDAPYALKTILSALFGVNPKDPKNNLQFNDIRYHIKYRTQDSLRLSQVRPNLQDFMKNSSYEVYPHHEQYFGQQDKIIDSERFSANLFGKLIRVGNAVYQRQEYVRVPGDERESGDLVEIGGEAYYVTATENEYYPDVILQKVTYSRNFNQLSNIVTIPSEPRFYEVSERSQVRREVRIMEFLLLTTKENAATINPAFMNNSKWRSIIRSLLFADSSYDMPNFAFVRFKGDKKRAHEGIPLNKLFPSTEISRASDNSVRPKDSSDHRDVIVPLMHFPLKNAIVFEWDMDDNFKAGDSIDTSISGKGGTDDAYYSMQPVRYCDIMGRADLFNFRLFRKTNWTLAQARRLPFAESIDFVPTEAASDFYLPDSLSIGLDKDNREALSFNYQINLLQEDETFVTYSNLFGTKGSRLQMCFLNVEASLFDDGVPITSGTIIADAVTWTPVDTSRGAIEIRITRPQNIDADAVKSIVLYEKDGASKYAYIAKNVSKMANDRKFNSWYIYPVFTR